MANQSSPPPPRNTSPGRGHENWGSKIGVILAVAGSAVGLGNFLRFPGLAATNGGAVFLIPYFISLLLLGIPLMWAEWAMGRYGGAHGHNSTPGIFTVLWRNPISKYFGVFAIIIPISIYMYYVYVEAWCLAYAWDFLRGTMRSYAAGAATVQAEVKAYSDHFNAFVGSDANGLPDINALVFLVIVAVINFYLIFRGVAKGIEVFCKIGMPLMFFIALIVLVRVLTLGAPDPAAPELNVNTGLGYMWNPKLVDGAINFALLKSPNFWLTAAGQIFFSISVGFGIVLNYASYLRRNDDIALSALSSAGANEFCEVCLGGLITIPMAFVFLGPTVLGDPSLLNITSSFSVGFKALPAVFARMWLGNFFGALFFFMLFIAAITSSLSMLQPGIAFLEQGFNLGRKASVTFLGLIVAIGNIVVVYFSKDLVALDMLDYWVGTVCIFTLATIQTIIFGWVWGIRKGKEEIDRGADLKIPMFWYYVIKFVSPLYLLTIIVFWIVYDLRAKIKAVGEIQDETVRGSTYFMFAFIAALFIFFIILIKLAGDRWEREGRGVNTAG